ALGAAPPIRTRGTLDDEPFELAVISDGEGAGKLLLAKYMVKSLGKRIGESIHVEIQFDNSEYGMSVPQDLLELFEFAPDVKHAFDTQLQPGEQRGMLYHIKSAKTQQTRSKRIAVLMEKLGINTF
ncbi:MAG: YdeI/OmpD-associated family protein, partial [Bacteroidota bacterium]